jgi:hypothetical protein
VCPREIFRVFCRTEKSVAIPAAVGDFSFVSKAHIDSVPPPPPSSLFNGYRGYFPGEKRPGREVDHLPLSCAWVKNELKCSASWCGGQLFRILPNAE